MTIPPNIKKKEHTDRVWVIVMLKSIKLFPLALTVIAAGALLSLSGCGGSSSTSATAPASRFVYVGGFSSPIYQYSVAGDGSLVPLSPPTVLGTETDVVYGLARSENGQYLYASTDDGIFQWSVGTDGQLTALSPATVPNLGSEYGIIVRGDNLYCDSLIGFNHFKIGSNGTLSFVATYTDTSAQQFAITPNGQSLYTCNGGSLWQYTINGDGSLTPKAVPSIGAPSVTSAYAIVINPAGTYAYVSDDNDNSIRQFSIGLDGQLSPLSPVSTGATGGNCYQLVMDNNGNVHEMNYLSPGYIQTFTPGAGGLLGAGVNFTTALTAPWIGMVSSQNRLYTLNYDDDVVSAYNLSATGAKTLIGTYSGPDQPYAIIDVRR